MVATAFLLLSAVIGCLGNGTGVTSKGDPQCEGKGQQCNFDFSQIIYCSGKGGNSYTVRNCRAENKMCSKTDANGFVCLKIVSDPPTEQLKNVPFVCHGNMMFPDPFFCNVAYACPSEGAFPDEICQCANGTALALYPFMHCTSESQILEDCSCPYMDRCSGKFNPGDFGDSCQPGYFYTCRQDPKQGIIPDVYKCPDGQIFVDGRCLSGADLMTSSLAKVVASPSCKKYEPPCLPEEGINCTTAGQLIHHKVERCYYACDSNLKPILRDCGSGSYFTCKYGPCGCTRKQTN